VGDARAKVAATLLLTLRGTPFLYYGEELGLRNLSVPNAVALDPPARRASILSPWWNRDQARGPMPWNSAPGAGFTTGQPWLPLPIDVAQRNVAMESEDEDSVLNTYRRLLRLRRATPALQRGDQELVAQANADALTYLRREGGSAAFVALSFAPRPVRVLLPPAPAGRAWGLAFSTAGRPTGEAVPESVTLEPSEALVATA